MSRAGIYKGKQAAEGGCLGWLQGVRTCRLVYWSRLRRPVRALSSVVLPLPGGPTSSVMVPGLQRAIVRVRTYAIEQHARTHTCARRLRSRYFAHLSTPLTPSSTLTLPALLRPTAARRASLMVVAMVGTLAEAPVTALRVTVRPE